MAIPLKYNHKEKPTIMKRLSLIIAVVVLFVASSCAPSYMCPTYTNADQAPQAPSELVQNDL